MNDDDISQDPKTQADDRVLHALMVHLHNPQAATQREQRLTRVLQALHQSAAPTLRIMPHLPPPTGRTLRFPHWARRSAWVVAAMLLIAVSIFALVFSPKPALASLNDILTALNRPGDHAFQISVDPPDPDFLTPAGLDHATLYLRDGTQYLLVRPDAKGGALFDGYDGAQSWRISGGRLAETRQGPGAGGLGMPQNMVDTLFSDLRPTLERIRTDYTVERLDQLPLPTGGDPLRHLVARRNSHDVKGPVVIEIWADSKTGMPHRIEFHDAKFQGSTQPRRLTFDLISETPLPADWFTPAVHVVDKMRG